MKKITFTIGLLLVISVSLQGQSLTADIPPPDYRLRLGMKMDLPGLKPGISIGYIGKWGILGFFQYGNSGFREEWRNTVHSVKIPHVGVEVTKRIFKKNALQLHAAAGPSYSRILSYSEAGMTIKNNSLGVNLGIIFDYKRASVTIGATRFFYNIPPENGKVISPATLVNAGLGIIL